MEQSFMFIPRTVSRKPSQDKKLTRTSAAKLKKNSPESSDYKVVEIPTEKISTDTNSGTTDVKQSSDISENKDSQRDLKKSFLQISQDKSIDSVFVATSALVEQTGTKYNEDIRPQTATASEEKTDTVESTEMSGFSFTSFAEAVCKHNNLDPSCKENQAFSQVPSNLPSKTQTDQSTERSEFSFSSFVEALYRQSNLPLIDVGSLSPRRKIPCFVRQRAPICKPQQPVFDPTGIGTSATRSFSMLTGRQGSRHLREVDYSGTGLVEPAAKRFKDLAAAVRRKPEESFGLPRDWELTQCGRQYFRKPKSQQGFDFTVMSYNILAQNLLEDNMYLYTDCDYHLLRWSYRKHQLLAELKHHTPDVICLQEVQKSHYEDYFQPELRKLGYDSAFVKRSGNKQDGCATFVKKSKFYLEKSIPIEYYHPDGGGVLDRDNVALIVKLKPLSEHVPSDRRVCVANTHLLFNPRRGDVKLAQIMVLLAELDKCGYVSDSQPDNYHALIMCGDFNSEPHSALYKLLTMGRLLYDGLLCRVVSGQQEGLLRGNNISLGKRFIPTEVGISDTCQYLDILKSRRNRSKRKQTLKEDTPDSDIEMTGMQGTGTLSHDFHLLSAYKHRISRLRHRHREITTYHNKASCTVDYIFYGVRYKEVRVWKGEVETRNVEEGQLHLLGRYGLLADHELQQMGGLPNEHLASDHVSLLTSFLLK